MASSRLAAPSNTRRVSPGCTNVLPTRTAEAATRRVRAVEHAALADLSREDERTVRAWLASLAALTTGPGQAEAEQKEQS